MTNDQPRFPLSLARTVAILCHVTSLLPCPDNAKELMSIDAVDGLLVGGAILQADTFLPIIEYDR